MSIGGNANSLIEQLKAVLPLDVNELLIQKPEDVYIDILHKGDFVTLFPKPMCEQCKDNCCPYDVAVTLFDIAYAIDGGYGIEKYINGKFTDTKNNNRPGMNVPIKSGAVCPHLDIHNRCKIYKDRPCICRSFPVMIERFDNKFVASWGACESFDITEDSAPFEQMLSTAISDFNEKVMESVLLLEQRDKVYALFSKYIQQQADAPTVMEEPKLKSVSVEAICGNIKICLTQENLTLSEINELRKSAQRLADEAKRQADKKMKFLEKKQLITADLELLELKCQTFDVKYNKLKTKSGYNYDYEDDFIGFLGSANTQFENIADYVKEKRGVK